MPDGACGQGRPGCLLIFLSSSSRTTCALALQILLRSHLHRDFPQSWQQPSAPIFSSFPTTLGSFLGLPRCQPPWRSLGAHTATQQTRHCSPPLHSLLFALLILIPPFAGMAWHPFILSHPMGAPSAPSPYPSLSGIGISLRGTATSPAPAFLSFSYPLPVPQAASHPSPSLQRWLLKATVPCLPRPPTHAPCRPTSLAARTHPAPFPIPHNSAYAPTCWPLPSGPHQ